jgi:fibronectin-binding autotransporter adhesin
MMTIAGNFTQGAGGTYQVMVNAAGQNSRLNVTGTAALAGTVGVQASQSNYASSTSYTILHATGGLGGTTFSGVSSNYAFLTPSLSYTSNDVMLTLLRSSFQGGVSTPNLKSVASALD